VHGGWFCFFANRFGFSWSARSYLGRRPSRRRGDIELGAADGLRGQADQVRRADGGVAGEPEVAVARVVQHDEENVGGGRLGGEGQG
jgi:hypothetical protein